MAASSSRSTRVCRVLALVVLVALLFATVVTASAEGTVDASAVSGTHDRIIVVGDVHGDVQQLQVALLMSEVIDKGSRRWSAGNATKLIMVGDLVDRGDEDKEVLDYVMQLQTDARAAGSDLVLVLGNHEIMNMQGHLHYVSQKSMDAFGGRHKHQEAFSADGVYGRWLRQAPLTHVEWGTLFVHAGLLPEFARLGLSNVEAQAKAEIESFGKHRGRQSTDDEVLGVHGPVWTRRIVHRAGAGDCRLVTETLGVLKLDRMIVGHTPQQEGSLGEFCEGRLIVVDIGMSRWMYGNMAVLEMTRNSTDGSVELREVVPRAVVEAKETTKEAEESGGPANDAAGADAADIVTAELKRDGVRLQEIFETMRQAERWESKKSAPAGEGDL